MTKPNPFSYLILIISVIILGVLSRKTNGIPSFWGDVLYSVMIYFGMRFLYLDKDHRKSMVFAFLFCFSIEFLQLYRAEWILTIRRTTLGHYVLGEGFLWCDLVCYTIGIITAFLIDWDWNKKTNTPTLF